MKRTQLLIFILILISGCNENLDFTEKDLNNHPWLVIFAPKVATLEGTHNIDSDELSMLLTTELSVPEYFQYVDSMAIKDGWNQAYKKMEIRVL